MIKSLESELIRIAAEMLTNQIEYLERPTKRDILNHRRKQWTWSMDLKAIADKTRQPIAHADVQPEMKSKASESWNFLHDSMLEECIESLESAANLMRGMTLDVQIPPITREVLRGRYQHIDALTERLTMSDPQAADVRPESKKGDE